MKKILCLIDILGVGGAERQMIGLALLLKKQGYYVDLVSYFDHDFHAELGSRYGIGSWTLHPGRSPWSKLYAVYRHIKRNGGYDHVIAFKDGPCSMACLLKLLGMKFSLVVSERNTTQQISLREKIKFLLFRQADYVVTNSYSQEQFVKEHFPHLAKKTVAITNFTDTDHFSVHIQNPGNTIQVLVVARIAKQKNVLRFLDAIAVLKHRGVSGVSFNWYGDVQIGEEEYGELVRTNLAELEVSDLIQFHPATPQIVQHYQQCDIFCLPSNYEGFPNVICEAMSCGKPVICSRVCDNPYIVRENENGLFFDNTSVDDMADKIQQMLRMSADELTQWGKKSRQIAVELFSQQAFVEKYIGLFNGKETKIRERSNYTNDVIVLGNDHYNPLNVVRALGVAGYHPTLIVVKEHGRHSFITRSKYVKESYVVKSEAEAMSLLMAMHFDQRVPVIACSDRLADAIDQNYDRLSGHYYLPNCGGKKGDLIKWMDKTKQQEAAKRAGLRVLDGIMVSTKAYELDDLRAVEFPCIVKPLLSSHASKNNFRICPDLEALTNAIDEVAIECDKVIIQKYIHRDYEFNILAARAEGKVLCASPGGYYRTKMCTRLNNMGMPCFGYVKQDLHPDIDLDAWRRFIDGVDYEGLFSTEFLISDGKAYFLEMNLRDDGDLFYWTHAGVNLPALLVGTLYGKDTSSLPRTFLRERTCGMNEVNYVKYQLRWHTLKDNIRDWRNCSCYTIFDRKDIRPFIYKFIYAIIK